jgi:hypothetical protein
MSLMSRIGKAARLLDLRGDAGGAVEILRAVLSDPAIEQHPSQKVEALVFLAEVHSRLGDRQQAMEYLGRFEALDLALVEADLLGPHLRRAQELRAALLGIGE